MKLILSAVLFSLTEMEPPLKGRFPQAVTIGRSRILINKNSDLALRNVAGHKAFHLWKSGVGRNSYIETVEDNMDFTSDAFRD